MQKTLFIIALCCLQLNISAWAQSSTILQEAESHTIGVNSDFNNNKAVLDIVAKTAEKNSLDISIKEHQYIERKNDKVYATLSLGNYVLNGYFTYLDFNIKPLLNPSYINYSYEWMGSNNKSIASESKTNQTFKSGATLVKVNKPYSNITDNSTISINEVVFHYSNADLEKLETFVKTVDDYYNADARLKMINQELDKVRKDTLELLNQFHQQCLDNIKTFNRIKSARYTSKLNLNANDPIQFKSHLGQTLERNKRIKKDLEYTLKNMHEAYYLKGKEWLDWGNKIKAESFFMQSIHEKELYAPAHYEIAELLFSKNNYQQAYDSLASIIEVMKPDNDTRYNSVKLGEKIIYVWLDNVYSFMEEGKANLAYKELDRIETERERIEGIKYFKEFKEIRGELFMAYYEELISEAQILIENGNLVRAQQGIDSLSVYRQANEKYYVGEEKENKLYGLLYTGWISKGNDYLEKLKPDSSVFALTNAKIICSTKESIICSEELFTTLNKAREQNYQFMILQAKQLLNDGVPDQALSILNDALTYSTQNNIPTLEGFEKLLNEAGQQHYNKLISEGQVALEQKDGRKSLAYFQEAIDIENGFTIKKDANLNNLAKESAIFYALSLCSESKSLIASTLLNEAQAKFEKAKSLKSNYKLVSKDLDNKLAEITNLLKQGECEKLQHKYNIQLEAGKIFISRNDFSNANNALNKAMVISKENPDCVFQDSLIKKLQNNIGPILNYQQKMARVENELQNDNFEKAIELYQPAHTYYMDSVKNNYGIESPSLYDFIYKHSNSQLLDNAIPYYLDLGEQDTALKLLNELYRREYIASWSKNSQTMLGQNLANSDFESDNSTNPKQKVLDYTKDIKWFSYLKKAYLSQWKTLN